MKNKKNLIKQIIYRSSHRGSKEMDLLLGNFVKKYINVFGDKDLSDLYELLSIEDEIIYKWYFKKENNLIIINNKITKMLRDYKFSGGGGGIRTHE